MKDYSERAGDIVSAVRALRRMGMRVGLPYQTADGVMFFQLDDCALTAIKQHWGKRVTTVFPRQGHYALDAKTVAQFPKPDISIERIGDLQKYSLDQLITAAS